MTRIKTERATYKILSVAMVGHEIVLHVQSTTTRAKRKLTRKDVSTTRWNAALSDFFRRQHATA